MVTNKDNFCVIMGGGIGSRFWPFSRKTLPKQFLDFFGTGRSLLQQTFDRFKQVIPMENNSFPNLNPNRFYWSRHAGIQPPALRGLPIISAP